jgi:hypothetical protein
VEIQTSAAADDGRARLLVHPFDVVQTNLGRFAGFDGLLRSTHQQGRFAIAERQAAEKPGGASAAAAFEIDSLT